MAKTYSAIQTVTAAGGESLLTIYNIPQNYNDLKIVLSLRGGTGVNSVLYFNGVSTSFTGRYVDGVGSGSATSGSLANFVGNIESTSQTANTFSIHEVYVPNYAQAVAHPFFADAATENASSSAYMDFAAGIWNPGTFAAINSVGIGLSSSTFVAGSTMTVYGIGSGAKATGGTVVGSGNFMYHTFTSSGAFTPTEQIKNAEVLLVGGGGGGGGDIGGGGGAGGVAYFPNQTLTAGTTYSLTVGGGGAGSASSVNRGSVGTDSYFGSLAHALGGGYGGGYNGNGQGGPGSTGGSGGGAGASIGTLASASGLQPSSTPGGVGYGNTGAGSTGFGSGGGGGAGGAGTTASGGSGGGLGGTGTSAFSNWHYATQTGVSYGGIYYIAGGGGGGQQSGDTYTGQGGNGGGGRGGAYPSTAAIAGTTNTGGGGGGGGQTISTGFAGGSGLIIVRYPIN
jgi:hypothetical protein